MKAVKFLDLLKHQVRVFLSAANTGLSQLQY